MKHPFIDDFKFSHAIFPIRDVGVNGHIEIYTGEEREFLPKYIKTPIVRIVYDNRKWSHWTSDYNHTMAVIISDNPTPLLRIDY